jgi:glycosyltransferase involved in cell wall biosynthesis
VFVFPSLTDTFGLVMLEALACGVPVAGFPVQGPRDVVGDSPAAVLDTDLRQACLKALEIPRSAARSFALTRSWRTCTEQFLSNLPVKVQIADPEPAPTGPETPRSASEPIRAVS